MIFSVPLIITIFVCIWLSKSLDDISKAWESGAGERRTRRELKRQEKAQERWDKLMAPKPYTKAQQKADERMMDEIAKYNRELTAYYKGFRPAPPAPLR